jgi:proteic killer suppression protein
VIVSFGDRATEALYHGGRKKLVSKFPPDVRRVGLRKLDVLNGASALQDLRSPPGNHLEALKGSLVGFHSIRINDQWRIVFRWEGGDAHRVSIADYH